MRYELLDGEIVVRTINADSAFMSSNYAPDTYQLSAYQDPPVHDPAEWLLDVGPFFDRFGAAKMSVLTSSNAIAQAVVKDCQVRKWINLQDAKVSAGIDALIAVSVSGVDSALKISILTTPVTAEENSALRKVYFSNQA